MNLLILFVLLVINFAISWWNAWAAGRGWTEVKEIGGWPRIVTWCAVIMAACGFSWVFLTIETMIVYSLGYFEPTEVEAMFNLGYLIIIFPVIGSGLGLWAHSLIVAYKKRSFGTLGVAGWNTYAQVHNIYSVAKHAPGAIESVLKVFGKSKSGRQAIALILLVVLALGGGVLTTITIVRKADRDHAIDVEASWA